MSTFSGQIRCKKFVSYSKLSKFDTHNRASWRLSPYRYSTFNRAYFVSMAASDAGITEEQMSAALRAYQTQFDQLLLNGHSIQMEGLGNFRLSCSMKMVEDAEDIDISLFERLRVVLRPSNELRNEIKSIQHIVDAPISVKSGDGKYILNYQLPYSMASREDGGYPSLQIWPAPGDRQGIDVSRMTGLFFIVSHPEYGDLKLTARAEGTGALYFESEGAPEMAINFITNDPSDPTFLDMDEMQQVTPECVIKMFGGQ